MEKVIVIKTNGFVDVLDSTFKISDGYVFRDVYNRFGVRFYFVNK